MIKKKISKVDSSPRSRGAKVTIRRKVLNAIGKDANVFDGFAGNGGMYRAVWKGARSCVGCDLRWFPDERTAYVANNLRVLRVLDLKRFNVFDLDAYGSPWHQALIVAMRRPVETGETIGLVLTEGSGLFLQHGGIPKVLAAITGLKERPAGVMRQSDAILEKAIHGLADKMNCAVAKRWQAEGKTGSRMRYIGLVLTGR